MKIKLSPALSRLVTATLTLAFVAMLTACATNKRVDWNSRVGNSTYDQVVSEIGPPDKQTTLSDGRSVADWITHRSGSGLSIGTGFGVGNVGVGVGQSIGSSRDHVLRLTFNKDGQLEAWSKN